MYILVSSGWGTITRPTLKRQISLCDDLTMKIEIATTLYFENGTSYITFQVHVASFSWILMAPVATSQFLQPIQFPHSIAWLPSVHEMRAVMNFERSSTTTVSSHCTRASRTSDRPWENKWSPVCVGVVCVGSGGGGDVILREEIQLVEL